MSHIHLSDMPTIRPSSSERLLRERHFETVSGYADNPIRTRHSAVRRLASADFLRFGPKDSERFEEWLPTAAGQSQPQPG